MARRTKPVDMPGIMFEPLVPTPGTVSNTMACPGHDFQVLGEVWHKRSGPGSTTRIERDIGYRTLYCPHCGETKVCVAYDMRV